MKPTLAIKSVINCIKAGVACVLWGRPGIGKTQSLETAITQQLKQHLLISHPCVWEPTDAKGLPFPSTDGRSAEFRPYGDLLQYIDAKEPTIVFLDDLGQAPHAVQAALMQVIHGRRINGHKISDKVSFVAASNRETDRAFVQRLITPLAGRCIHINFDVDHDDWCAWALQNDIRPEIIAYIRFKSSELMVFDPKSSEKAFASPRSWEYLSRIMDTNPDQDIETELFQGTVGEGVAAGFQAYRRVFQDLPNIDALLMNPSAAKVPERPDALYAIAETLATRADEENFGRVIEYAYRMPPEFATVTVLDATKKEPELQHTHAFTQWAVKFNCVQV